MVPKKRHWAIHVLTALLTVGVMTGTVAAQQSEINNSLTEIEQFVATTLGQLG
ncbi:hypothetical protein GCM10025751_26220 [Haladaptatus pallidirubidus]|uniref:Uncharacterized protein n=1 Tax=Haladaptatus pallidirubidus TaxID=1008152 RepID=A0AAV3UI47_9EURY